ncbi:protein kinase domain-containing protein [Actinocorallia aurantiaca]|uniref:non-specific serine/threonine protein kinase n=1 Tax=Actinocorallia aurantiaca TaxID=46204 RepID=A0ABN3U3M7_9ACTN
MNGRLIAGRYRLRAPIGAGGMGEVWEAYDERLDDRRVVVKMMLAERPAAFSPPMEALEIRRERFLREVRTTAAIEHLGVPAVYDAGTDPETGRLFVVMQLLRGRELRTLIDETDHEFEPLSVARVAAIGAQIASVLHEVHRRDVVHRDVKPANLMLTPGGVVKVLDFGVASLLGSGDNPRLTQVGMTVGTPPYMSPEQSLANAVGPASDVYALACVLYEALTGDPPFTETSALSHLWHHVHSEPEPIRNLRPDVPREVETLLLEMLGKLPDDRPEAEEVYERLLPLTSGLPGPLGDLADLDPCLPFTRPLGGSLRGRRTAAPPIRTPSPPPPITEREVEELAERVDGLLQEQRFTPAIDLLGEALSRAADPELADDLSFRLAHVLFIAGHFTEAAELFTEVGSRFARRYGPQDPDALMAGYYLAQCRAELGEVTAAIEAFQYVVGSGFDHADDEAIERHLDALASLMRLHAAARSRDLLLQTAAQMREAIALHRPQEAPVLLADLDAYLNRLTRLLSGTGSGEPPQDGSRPRASSARTREA